MKKNQDLISNEYDEKQLLSINSEDLTTKLDVENRVKKIKAEMVTEDLILWDYNNNPNYDQSNINLYKDNLVSTCQFCLLRYDNSSLYLFNSNCCLCGLTLICENCLCELLAINIQSCKKGGKYDLKNFEFKCLCGLKEYDIEKNKNSDSILSYLLNNHLKSNIDNFFKNEYKNYLDNINQNNNIIIKDTNDDYEIFKKSDLINLIFDLDKTKPNTYFNMKIQNSIWYKYYTLIQLLKINIYKYCDFIYDTNNQIINTKCRNSDCKISSEKNYHKFIHHCGQELEDAYESYYNALTQPNQVNQIFDIIKKDLYDDLNLCVGKFLLQNIINKTTFLINHTCKKCNTNNFMIRYLDSNILHCPNNACEYNYCLICDSYFKYDDIHYCDSHNGYMFDINKIGFDYNNLIENIYEYYFTNMFAYNIIEEPTEIGNPNSLYDKRKQEFMFKKCNIILYLYYSNYKEISNNINTIFNIFNNNMDNNSIQKIKQFFEKEKLDQYLKKEISYIIQTLI